ncbi:MAG: beta-lactamase family protein [Opitutae bacterium]|nr:beta-lactamase family protein [Opitutae bacterium]MBT5908467.1 beta-lactamase family protein [Opitutae bacterium]MBT6850097.1 beta-lactamase family protein [Opitutae bacterium]MBT7922924.1 beta-lactamase family protein [Opitutae bacterium]
MSGCSESPTAPLQSAELEDVFDLPKLQSIGDAITKAQEEKHLPEGVLWVERNGVHFTEAYGKASVEPVHSPAQPDTIYAAASLTKVVATITAALLLHERGNLSIDDTVKKYFPEFTGDGRDAVTLRHLLTHTSGLRPDIRLRWKR